MPDFPLPPCRPRPTQDYASHHTWVAGHNLDGEPVPPVNVFAVQALKPTHRTQLSAVTPETIFAGRRVTAPLAVASPRATEKSKGSVNKANQVAILEQILTLCVATPPKEASFSIGSQPTRETCRAGS